MRLYATCWECSILLFNFKDTYISTTILRIDFLLAFLYLLSVLLLALGIPYYYIAMLYVRVFFNRNPWILISMDFFSILRFKDETIIFITFIGRYLKVTQTIATATTTTTTFFFIPNRRPGWGFLSSRDAIIYLHIAIHYLQ